MCRLLLLLLLLPRVLWWRWWPLLCGASCGAGRGLGLPFLGANKEAPSEPKARTTHSFRPVAPWAAVAVRIAVEPAATLPVVSDRAANCGPRLLPNVPLQPLRVELRSNFSKLLKLIPEFS